MPIAADRSSHPGLRRTSTISALLAAAALLPGALVAQAAATPAVAYPEGYRGWAHVRSRMIAPAHARFASDGGFQHVYANAEAMTGFRTQRFPVGSVVVMDWLELRDTAGTYAEGPRRHVDVMVKDAKRFAATGGWGFQRFEKDSRTDLAVTPTPPQCFACHDRLKADDLVMGKYRP